MSWWGKVLGGAFGYMLGGPLGALLGATFGHNFDAGLRVSGRVEHGKSDIGDRERTQTAFFTATFAVLGSVAKADGQVTRDEIQLATALMDQMGLNSEQKRTAQQLFAEGKRADFALDDVLDQLRRECRLRHSLLRMFLEIQFQAAYVNGIVHPGERRLLLHICDRLGFTRHEFDIIETTIRSESRFRQRQEQVSGGISLTDAYTLLDVTPGADAAVVKRAYRRLMSQNHPDKLVSKGLPEEMIKLATEKTQRIKAAYEKIRNETGNT
ncbi:MAG: co-chaperone DjlA [Gammaproteobacteria bacterium]|nr:co-chaperone DjlA [Gammaproteobacteria bacterium]